MTKRNDEQPRQEASDARIEMMSLLVSVKTRKGVGVAKNLVSEIGKSKRMMEIPEELIPAVTQEAKELLGMAEAFKKPSKRKVGMPTNISAPYGAIQPDHHSANMAPYTIGLPGDLNANTTKLVLDFANAMGRKLFAAQQKHDYEDEWKQDGGADGGFESDDVLRECMFQHMLKGDPVDVANYAAFAAYHGVSTRPMDAEEAGIWVGFLQSQFDLHNENNMLRGVMDAMEERHGDQFNAFFESIMLRVLIATGLPSISLDTAALFQQVAGKDTTGHYVEIVEAPGQLTYVLRQSGDVLHTDLFGKVESVMAEPEAIKELRIDWLNECPRCEVEDAKVVTSGSEKYLHSGDGVTCAYCGLEGNIEIIDEAAQVAWNPYEKAVPDAE